MEMYSKSGPDPQTAVYDSPSVDKSKGIMMEENPAYQAINYSSKDVMMEQNPVYQAIN